MATVPASTPQQPRARPAAAARQRAGARAASTIAYETYGELAADKSNAILVCHALTGDQHRRQPAPDHRQAGLVGPHGRPRQADRHRPLPRDLRQRDRRLHGLDRPGEPRRPTASPTAMRFPVITIRDMVRAQVALLDALGIDAAARRGRRLDGRDAGAEPGRQLPRARRAACWRSPPPRAIRRRTSPSTRSAARRSWPIPNWRGGDYYGSGKGPEQGPRGGAHGGAHHLSVRSRADREVRPPAAGPRGQELRLRRRFPGRKLSAPPGDRASPTGSTPTRYLYITRAMDYFDLAEEHGGRLADAFAGTTARFCLVSFDTDWLYPDRRIARDRPCAQRRRRAGQLRRAVGAATATTASCSTCPRSTGWSPASSTMSSTLRPDLAVIAAHVAPGSRVLDVGCGDGALMAALRDDKRVDARGMEIDPGAMSQQCVARGLSVVQGDADRDLADYPDDAFDYAILSQTLQTAERPDLMLDELLRIGRKAFVSFPNFAHWRMRAVAAVGRADAGDAAPAGELVRDARTSTTSRSTISASCSRDKGVRGRAQLVLQRRPGARRGRAPTGAPNTRCSC